MLLVLLSMFLEFFQFCTHTFEYYSYRVISSYLFFMNLAILILQVIILFHFLIPFPHQIQFDQLDHKKEPIVS